MEELDDEDFSMAMAIDEPDMAADEFYIRWRSICQVYETGFSYPTKLEESRCWTADPSSPMKNVAFTGHGMGFKPGMDLGPYDPK